MATYYAEGYIRIPIFVEVEADSKETAKVQIIGELNDYYYLTSKGERYQDNQNEVSMNITIHHEDEIDFE